jgi:putative SOS response-associated peptidase YedK
MSSAFALTIASTTPNELLVTINHERMPVLLTREDEFETWLHGTPTEATSANIVPASPGLSTDVASAISANALRPMQKCLSRRV